MKTIFIDVETGETLVTTNLTAAKQTRIYGPEFFLFVPDHLVQEESKLSLKKWSKVPHLSVATDPHLLGWNVLALVCSSHGQLHLHRLIGQNKVGARIAGLGTGIPNL